MSKKKKKPDAGYPGMIIKPQTLKDLLYWLIQKECLEKELGVPIKRRCVARWTIFPHVNRIFVGMASALEGPQMLRECPELFDLPLVPQEDEELAEGLEDLPFRPHVYYFGPFGQSEGNLI